MLRIGVIGCGGIAGAHISGYLALADRVRVTAVCDVDDRRAGAAAATVGEARVCSSIEDLLRNPDVDAVDICLPHHLHASTIVAAARHGKHVLCEKPLCTSHTEAAAIETAVRSAGITLMCAHNQLFEPAIARARELLRAGALGDIYLARTCDCFIADNTLEGWGWRRELRTMGGGELIDTGYHPTYTMLYLLGLANQRPVDVTSLLGRHRQVVLEGEDTAHVLVRFSGGAIGQILTSWAFEFPHGSYSFHLIGDRGELFGRDNVATFLPRDGEQQITTFEEVNSYHAQLPQFVDSIENRTRPLQNEEDGIAVLNVILAAYESDASKRTVSI